MRLEKIIVTDRLTQRPTRTPNLLAENRALLSLGKCLTRKPEFLFQKLVDITLRVCKAGSAGLSLISRDADNREFFKWAATSGAYSRFKGGRSDREMSPCGTCISRGTPQLYDRPARHFIAFKGVEPPIIEGLVVPIFVDAKAVGTIWIVSHNSKRKFDREDVRMMESIAGFIAGALLRAEKERALQAAQEFNDTILQNSLDCIKVLDAAGKLLYVNEPGLKILAVGEPAKILNKLWFEFWSPQHRDLAANAFAKSRPGKPTKFQGLCPTFKGEEKWWEVNVIRLPGEDRRTLVISKDITRQRTAEEAVRKAHAKLAAHATELEDRVAIRTKELHALNGQLQKLSRKLLKTQEEERRHIANELHDEMGQHLTGLKLVLNAVQLRSADQSTELRRAQEVVATLMRQVRDLSFDLRQSLPDHINLVTALNWHFEKLKQDQKLKVQFECKDKLKEVPPDVTRTVYRLVQEALTNVVRHSGTSRARVALGLFGDHVRLSIADRGRGFHPDEIEAGTGLRGMRERILLSGGTFDLKTKSSGTRIDVDIPLKPL